MKPVYREPRSVTRLVSKQVAGGTEIRVGLHEHGVRLLAFLIPDLSLNWPATDPRPVGTAPLSTAHTISNSKAFGQPRLGPSTVFGLPPRRGNRSRPSGPGYALWESLIVKIQHEVAVSHPVEASVLWSARSHTQLPKSSRFWTSPGVPLGSVEHIETMDTAYGMA